MRVQLAAFALTLLIAAPAWAQVQDKEAWEGDAKSRVLVYSDDDRTTVVTSVVDAETALPGHVAIGAHALIDVVSSASADVVSAATERWTENRVEVGGRVKADVSGSTVGLSYTRSQENDWRSNSFFISGSRELFQRNTVVTASYGFVRNNVGRASDPTFEETLDVHMGEVGASQLLDSKTRIGGAYTLQRLSGFMASPYRFAPIMDGSRAPERHPDRRIRQAVSAYVLRSLARSVAGRLSYRFYLDDWGVRSHTGTLRFAFEPTRWLTAGIEGRLYQQNRADFYRQIYDNNMLQYMSNDRELSTFWDAGGSTNLQAKLGPVTVDAQAGVIYYKFRNFSPLKKRTALIVSGGAKLSW